MKHITLLTKIYAYFLSDWSESNNEGVAILKWTGGIEVEDIALRESEVMK